MTLLFRKLKPAATFIILITFITFLYSGSPGSSGALFLNYSPSARASSMANSFSSVSDDVFSTYYNPAGLVNIDLIQVGASYTKSFEDITSQYLTFAYPYRIGQVFGFSYQSLSNGDIQGYDAKGAATSKIDTSNKAIYLSYSRALTKDEIERPVLSVGGNFKYISQTLDSVSANTFALDLGAIYHLRPDKYWMKEIPAQEFNFSFLIKNFGPGLKFDKEATPLPFSITLGASWTMHPWTKHKLTLSLDNVISNDNSYKMLLGAEYFLFQMMFARIGFESSKDVGSKISFGVGFRLSFVDVDYSLGNYGDLGNMHKFNVVMRFGMPKVTRPLEGEIARVEKAKTIAPKEKIEELEMYASDFLKLAEKNIDNMEYVQARDNITKAFNLDPSFKKTKWEKILSRLEDFINGLKLEKEVKKLEILKGKSEQSKIAFDVIKNWLLLNDKKAFIWAHIMYGTNPKGPVVFEEILNFIAKEYGFAIRTDELLAKDAWIIYKLKKSANYFYLKQFNMVVENCEEILMVDENNYLATVRLGSAYFMLGDKDNAKKYYEKALEINPSDTITFEFMKKQGWR